MLTRLLFVGPVEADLSLNRADKDRPRSFDLDEICGSLAEKVGITFDLWPPSARLFDACRMPHSNSKCHDLKLESAKLAELIKEKPEPRAKPSQ